MRELPRQGGLFDVDRECPEPSINPTKRSKRDDRLSKAKLN
jgi:hypothetical protein